MEHPTPFFVFPHPLCFRGKFFPIAGKTGYFALSQNYKTINVNKINKLNANNYNYRDLIRYSPPKHTPWTHAHNKEAMNEWDSNQIP